jgi:hypothetical protein
MAQGSEKGRRKRHIAADGAFSNAIAATLITVSETGKRSSGRQQREQYIQIVQESLADLD